MVKNANKKNKALFLDRDGVICRELGRYLLSPDEFELLEGAAELTAFARKNGYLVVVVTNQPQIAKKLLTDEKLAEIHEKMQKLLSGNLNAIYYCPHRNEDNCECRKPKSAMFIRAAESLNIDLAKSFVVGDKNVDIEAGQNAGCKTIFLNNGLYVDRLALCSPDFVVDGLSQILSLLD